jgi:hypothetical protein
MSEWINPFNVIPIIQQLKTYAPIFNGNVFGVGEASDANDDKLLAPYPYAIVICEGAIAEPNIQQSRGGLKQIISVKIAVESFTDGSGDLFGFTGQTAQAACGQAIWAAILNPYNPDTNYPRTTAAQGLYLAPDAVEPILSTLPRTIWRWNFLWDVTVTNDLGFQQPSQPLNFINSNISVNSVFVDMNCGNLQTGSGIIQL